MRCSRGGRHNIICTEPIQNALCQSAISRTEALCINSSVINTHHAHKMQSRRTESNLVWADTLDEDALPDEKTNKQIKAGDSVWQVKHFHLDIFKAQMLTASVREKKPNKLLCMDSSEGVQSSLVVMVFKVKIKRELSEMLKIFSDDYKALPKASEGALVCQSNEPFQRCSVRRVLIFILSF